MKEHATREDVERLERAMERFESAVWKAFGGLALLAALAGLVGAAVGADF